MTDYIGKIGQVEFDLNDPDQLKQYLEWKDEGTKIYRDKVEEWAVANPGSNTTEMGIAARGIRDQINSTGNFPEIFT